MSSLINTPTTTTPKPKKLKTSTKVLLIGGGTAVAVAVIVVLVVLLGKSTTTSSSSSSSASSSNFSSSSSFSAPNTPEVYVYYNPNSLYTSNAAAGAMCTTLGGVQATITQLTAAYNAGGQWCDGGMQINNTLF
jgi:flagellar basal body-associated protein FliL